MPDLCLTSHPHLGMAQVGAHALATAVDIPDLDLQAQEEVGSCSEEPPKKPAQSMLTTTVSLPHTLPSSPAESRRWPEPGKKRIALTPCSTTPAAKPDTLNGVSTCRLLLPLLSLPPASPGPPASSIDLGVPRPGVDPALGQVAGVALLLPVLGGLQPGAAWGQGRRASSKESSPRKL